ncbi:Lsr2 family protein [Amycolatopsis sp. SID8362]|uniref:histone-like nucleoid-structuring protein Lsr2 n=1 Tax=Amycolatopsis sp. SID8362 TaxID=2690346 RepID=UPI001370DF86|nr:Lsr2 family protein [Amycolatopsis sp. SID8362]NBH02584.1 Lsr2 family protein [Amycolatopsis sp. SID8362]NED39286.1 Lsr2 family protein [Amycolatopsis sp. SID8362]
MAQRVLIEVVDDLDGGAATQTVPFALDGVSYEIDLSDENAAALRDEFARYIEAGRRTGGRRIKVTVGQSTAGNRSSSTGAAQRERNQEVRAWAQANGYGIAERGRIPKEIYAAFKAAEPTAPAVEPEPESAGESAAKPDNS